MKSDLITIRKKLLNGEFVGLMSDMLMLKMDSSVSEDSIEVEWDLVIDSSLIRYGLRTISFGRTPLDEIVFDEIHDYIKIGEIYFPIIKSTIASFECE